MKSLRTSFRALVMACLVSSGNILANQYFVSPTGNDGNPGTIEQPFLTLLRAHNEVSPGDTIYIRGGTHTFTTTQNLSKNGTENMMYYLLSYPGERALLDFSGTAFGSRGINLSGNYWYIYGLDIRRAGDNGMMITGDNNVIEYCSFYENQDTGLQLHNGASSNRIKNCDSYFNVDPGQGNADGFAAKLSVGDKNYFYGCRAWQNSDDGFDGYLRESLTSSTVMENCWIFANGYLPNGNPSSGNGNGFKMGGGDNGNSDSTTHFITLKKCLAFNNRVKGFDQNNNRGTMIINNGTAFGNGTNFSIPGAIKFGESAIIVNGTSHKAGNSIANHVVQQTNSWMLGTAVVDSDFESIDTSGVRGPRKPDGSLPDLPFMKLAGGSKLIDVGTYVGLQFTGTAPDLGAFEYGLVTTISKERTAPDRFTVSQNFPNPFNPATTIHFIIPNTGFVSVRIFNILGQLTKELMYDELVPGTHSIQWDATDNYGKGVASGTYFASIQYRTSVQTLKLVLLR